MEGNQIRGLMEAYSEVYQPSIITEEVVQEAADMWVEACIAYGIDFSEYTLDELTEAFIVDMSSEELSESVLNEILGMPSAQNLGASLRQGFGKARRAVGGAIKSAGKGVLDVAGAGAQGVVGQKTTSKNPLARLANATTRQATKVPRAAASFGAGFLTGKPGSTKPTAKPAPAKPTANPSPTGSKPTTNPAPAKPAPDRAEPLWGPGSSKPSASKPATAAPAKPVVKQTGDKAKDMATWAKANPTLANKPKTPNPLMKDMPGATLKKAQEAPKPQMSARAQALKAGGPPKGPRERMLNQDLDLFDVIKGHLLDEGFAETEEAAVSIMANMSEEWRKSIVEGWSEIGANVTDALPWNRNTKYTTQGKLRKPGENVHGQQTGRKPTSTSAITSDGKPR